MKQAFKLLCIAVLLPSVVMAEPCGDLAQEGMCMGKELRYCNAGELQVKQCPSCCNWGGNKYKCLEDCPANGECVNECNDPSVFGCSLMNTHEWTCVIGDDDCVKRIYTVCPDGQICDESTTHKCTDISNVDLCGGVPKAGVCHGSVHKQCINGQIVSKDCAEEGRSCLKSGCTSDCPVACLSGETGCNSSSKAWSCIQDPVSGCWEKGVKSCGVKTCVDGICIVPTPDEGPDDLGDEGPEDLGMVESVVEESIAPPSRSSGCFVATRNVSGRDGIFLLLASLLGLLIFVTSVRKKLGS
ncbi:MAG TPA: hypothetical protein EYN66_05955 [Myxococcales bacterium]|nr:hypothetical protein [Myxococcales bacterium]